MRLRAWLLHQSFGVTWTLSPSQTCPTLPSCLCHASPGQSKLTRTRRTRQTRLRGIFGTPPAGPARKRRPAVGQGPGCRPLPGAPRPASLGSAAPDKCWRGLGPRLRGPTGLAGQLGFKSHRAQKQIRAPMEYCNLGSIPLKLADCLRLRGAWSHVPVNSRCAWPRFRPSQTRGQLFSQRNQANQTGHSTHVRLQALRPGPARHARQRQPHLPFASSPQRIHGPKWMETLLGAPEKVKTGKHAILFLRINLPAKYCHCLCCTMECRLLFR